jgi:ribonuclease R
VKLGMGQRVVVRLMEAVPVTGGLTLELLSLDGAALPTASGRGGKRGGFQPRQPSKAAAKDRALKRKVIRKRK